MISHPFEDPWRNILGGCLYEDLLRRGTSENVATGNNTKSHYSPKRRSARRTDTMLLYFLARGCSSFWMVPNWTSNAAGGKLNDPFLLGGNRDVPWPIASSVPRESQAGISKTAFWSLLLSTISDHFVHIYTAGKAGGSWHTWTYRCCTSIEDTQEDFGLQSAKSRKEDLPLSLMIVSYQNGCQKSKQSPILHYHRPIGPPFHLTFGK
jgi:hypothetical protein